MTAVIHHKLTYSDPDVFTIRNLCDVHLGHVNTSEKLLQKDIDAIRDDPFAYWIYGGDGIDAISTKGDNRYKPSSMAPWLHGYDDVIGAQRDRLIDMLSPIADKCLGWVCGNHELNSLDWYGRNLHWELLTMISQKAKKPPQSLDLGYGGFISLSFRQQYANSTGHGRRLNIYIHHGAGGGLLHGGHALALGRSIGWRGADLHLFGHRHVQIVDTYIFEYPGSTGVAMKKTKIAAFCGTYLGNESEWGKKDAYRQERVRIHYADKKGLPATPLGTLLFAYQPLDRSLWYSNGHIWGATNVSTEAS